MSTIVVVRKGHTVCIASDTLKSAGSTRQPAVYSRHPSKVFKAGDTYVGTIGLSAHQLVLESYFRKKGPAAKLHDRLSIFETWVQLHKELEKNYHLNPGKEDDDDYQTSRVSLLLANAYGIFEVTPSRYVEEYSRFWAIGSGSEYALGALYALYDACDTAEEVAQQAVRAAAEFDDATGLPLECFSVRLHEASSGKRRSTS